MFVCPRRPGLRPLAIVATVMALLLLAVSQLSPPGNYGADVESPVIAVMQASCGHEHPGDQTRSHQQRQGDTWTSVAQPRLRPPLEAAGFFLPVVLTAPGLVAAPAPAADCVTVVAPVADQPGVLRI
ncbi:hypothetical protein AB0G04_37725 [Actinoplanes sp. NPDC023801]|uniref:hypothetical protein n=1 Tax=Actinoplanes sp. NPDC023801 TaxID=3154595 RepID=UPI0033D01BFD